MSYRRTTKLDMHIHTPSSDGHGSPEEYVKAIKKAGLDGVVLTDHHITRGPGASKYETVEPGERAAGDIIQTAIKKAGLICLRGCEYSSGDGHVLIYGADVDDLDLGLYCPMQEVIWRAQEAGGVAFPSHPYHGYKKRLGDGIYKLKGLVAVEGFNGQLATSHLGELENADAVKAGKAMGIGIVGNSDAHQAKRIGTCYTEFDGSIRWAHELVEALKEPTRYRARVNKRMVAAQKGARTKGYSLRGPSRSSYSGWVYEPPKLPRPREPLQLPARFDQPGDRWWEAEAPSDSQSLWNDIHDPFHVEEDPQAVARLLSWMDGEEA